MLKTLLVLANQSLIAFIGLACIAVSAHTQTVSSGPTTAHWHCSKHPSKAEFNLASASSGNPKPEAEDLFDLTPARSNTLGVSLSDLVDAYSGRPVQMGSQQLTACFMVGQTPLNQSAQDRLGMQWATLQQQHRRSNLRYAHVRMVQSETEMLQCISDHYPAVGYLSEPTETPSVGPCY